MSNCRPANPARRTEAARKGQMLYFRKSGKVGIVEKLLLIPLSVSLKWVIIGEHT